MSRRSRYIREGPSFPMRLVPRDLEILATVGRLRICSSWHVHALLFPGRSGKVCQLRLQKLWWNGYLDRAFHPLVLVEGRAERGSSCPVYLLARPGEEVLRAAGHEDVRAPHAIPSPLRLRHDLQIVDAQVAVEVATPKMLGGPLLYWLDGAQIGTRMREVFAPQELAIPDAAFALPPVDVQSAPTAWLLEIDRGTEPILRTGPGSALAEKLRRYAAGHASGTLTTAVRFPAHRVLFVVRSPARADRLLAAVRALQLPPGLFWVSTEVCAAPDGPPGTFLRPERIFAPAWQCAGCPRWHALTEPADAPRAKGGSAVPPPER